MSGVSQARANRLHLAVAQATGSFMLMRIRSVERIAWILETTGNILAINGVQCRTHTVHSSVKRTDKRPGTRIYYIHAWHNHVLRNLAGTITWGRQRYRCRTWKTNS